MGELAEVRTRIVIPDGRTTKKSVEAAGRGLLIEAAYKYVDARGSHGSANCNSRTAIEKPDVDQASTFSASLCRMDRTFQLINPQVDCGLHVHSFPLKTTSAAIASVISTTRSQTLLVHFLFHFNPVDHA